MQPDKIGPWRIEKKIGAGGMGSVYLGVHEESGQQAAVKVLPAALAREEGFVARFNREVESMQSLANPYIVEFIESGVDNETYYYAMEFVDGDTLTNILRRDKRIPWEQVVEYAVQICSALKAAHDAGIIHRDLKPSNLLIDKEGVIKLTDFGVAQVFAAGKLTVTGGIIGTAEYMSPEQAQGQRASKKSDLYSLGAVMYVMLTGRPPFSGKTTLDVIQKHKFGQFDRPNMYVPEIPLWLNDIVCQLLEKEPDKRFPDAYVLSRRLQEMMNRHKQKLLDATLNADDLDASAQTVALNAPADPNDPNATLMRDLLRAQIEEAQAKGTIGNLLDNTFVLILLLAALVLGGFYMLSDSEPTPEEMFASAQKIMEQPAGSDWLRAKRDYLEPLLEADPERWSEQVLPLLEQVEEYEATRPRLVSGRLMGGTDSEPRRLLQLADHYRSIGEYDRAASILQSLQILLQGSEEHAATLVKVQQRLKALDSVQDGNAGRQKFFDEALGRARALVEGGQTEQARAVCLSLLALYRDDPSASDVIRQTRDILSRLPAN